MEDIVAYPGTFDPITNGHIEIIERASKIFNKVVVLVAKRDEKKTIFTLEERLNLVKTCVKPFKNVEVDKLDILLVDYLTKHNIKLILRGLRSASDFDYEMQMFEANYTLNKDIETIFLIARNNSFFISSTLVKEIALNGGDISKFVPNIVYEKLIEKVRRGI